MQERTLGTGGLRVSAIGLGCMGMSEFYGTSDEARSIATLEHAIDRGITFWDTADMYGAGGNEKLLSRVLAKHREAVVLATKFGVVRGEDGGFLGINGRPEYILKACDKSLVRLAVDHIDLYYQHRVDPDVAIEESVGAMAELVRAGKVRFLGLSEAAPQTLHRAAAVHPITALQTEYSLFSRELEAEILPTLRELGIGLVAYSPLGRGLLTGKIRSITHLDSDDFRRMAPRFQEQNLEQNLKLVEGIGAMSAAKGCTPAQLALAWLLGRGDDIVPIPGTRRSQRIDENAAAASITLSWDEMAEIDRLVPPEQVAGGRYPEALRSTLDG